MELRISDSNTLPLEGIQIARDFSAFSVFFKESDDNLLSTEIQNHLAYPRLDYDLANYRVALFKQGNWPESRILDVRFGKQRIGLLFSLQALASEETQLKLKTPWNDCGFIALQKILLGEYEFGPREFKVTSEAFVPNQTNSQPITVLFPEDTIVIVLDKRECKKVMSDSEYESLFVACLPSFVLSGFFPQTVESYLTNTSGLLEFDSHTDALSLRTFSKHFPSEASAFFLRCPDSPNSQRRECGVPTFSWVSGSRNFDVHFIQRSYSRLCCQNSEIR